MVYIGVGIVVHLYNVTCLFVEFDGMNLYQFRSGKKNTAAEQENPRQGRLVQFPCGKQISEFEPCTRPFLAHRLEAPFAPSPCPPWVEGPVRGLSKAQWIDLIRRPC